jgi:hypothetical protein
VERKLEPISTTVLNALSMYMRNAGRDMWEPLIEKTDEAKNMVSGDETAVFASFGCIGISG